VLSFLGRQTARGARVISFTGRGIRALWDVGKGDSARATQIKKEMREYLESIGAGDFAIRLLGPRQFQRVLPKRLRPKAPGAAGVEGGPVAAVKKQVQEIDRAVSAANQRARTWADATAESMQRLVFAGREFRDVLQDILYQFAQLAAQHLIFDKVANKLFAAFGGQAKPADALAEVE
jgi:hypothetical protein